MKTISVLFCHISIVLFHIHCGRLRRPNPDCKYWAEVPLMVVVFRHWRWLHSPSSWLSSLFGHGRMQIWPQKQAYVHIKKMCWPSATRDAEHWCSECYRAARNPNQVSSFWLLPFQNGRGIAEQSGNNITHYVAHCGDMLVQRLWGGGTSKLIKLWSHSSRWCLCYLSPWQT